MRRRRLVIGLALMPAACAAFGAEVPAGDAPAPPPAAEAGASTGDAPSPPGADADVRRDVDATASPLDVCLESTCQSLGGACTTEGVCERTCRGNVPCKGPDPSCPPGIPCVLRCTEADACDGASCGEASSCLIDCAANGACGGSVRCARSASCRVTCAEKTCPSEVRCQPMNAGVCTVTCLNGDCAVDGQRVRCCPGNTCESPDIGVDRKDEYCAE